MWQLPVLPVAVLLLAGALLAPARQADRGADSNPASTGRGVSRTPSVVAARRDCRGGRRLPSCIAIPLASTEAVRQSQAAARAGDTEAALADAKAAIRVEPAAASAQLQAALVLELQHDFSSALKYAQIATTDEPANWQNWLVRSRIEAEAGHPAQAVAAFRRARSLNPQSAIFRT